MDIVGLVTFLIAAYLAWSNHKRTGHATLVWFLIMIGVSFGALFSLANIFLLSNIYPSQIGDVKNLFLTGEIVTLSLASYVSVKHLVKPL